MNEKAWLVCRAVANTLLAFAAAASFVLAWTAPGFAEGTRRLTSFGLALAFVVFWHEAVRSCKGARTAGRMSR